jgi:hypothetical protein
VPPARPRHSRRRLFAPKPAHFAGASLAKRNKMPTARKRTHNVKLQAPLSHRDGGTDERERDANIPCRFIASFLHCYFFSLARTPRTPLGTLRTRLPFNMKKNSQLRHSPSASIEFSPICSVRRLSAFQRPIIQESNPGSFENFCRLQPSIRIHTPPTLLCGSVPAESEPR